MGKQGKERNAKRQKISRANRLGRTLFYLPMQTLHGQLSHTHKYFMVFYRVGNVPDSINE
jgi:hypothetical protein